ncbi:hypothetical protein B0H14DRAFT_2585654 [Mycena olivaceomarginata]|nr:hypothetical protein B0H14DRAFT_2585654 [Mycena olivaceomarginata]
MSASRTGKSDIATFNPSGCVRDSIDFPLSPSGGEQSALLGTCSPDPVFTHCELLVALLLKLIESNFPVNFVTIPPRFEPLNTQKPQEQKKTSINHGNVFPGDHSKLPNMGVGARGLRSVKKWTDAAFLENDPLEDPTYHVTSKSGNFRVTGCIGKKMALNSVEYTSGSESTAITAFRPLGGRGCVRRAAAERGRLEGDMVCRGWAP